MQKTIFLSKDIDVLVVSAGGVGTTFLMEAISAFKMTNCPSNTDFYKHSLLPPIPLRSGVKVVYVFGEPITALISLFRRQYHHALSVQLSRYKHKKNILPLSMTLSEYAKLNTPVLDFEAHFLNWYSNFRFYDTFFVHYESLYDSLESLSEFLELPPAFIDHFPPKRSRQSDKKHLAPSDLYQLEQTYKTYSVFLQKLERFFIRPKSDYYTSKFLAFTSHPYCIAYKRSILKKMPLVRKLLQLSNK